MPAKKAASTLVPVQVQAKSKSAEKTTLSTKASTSDGNGHRFDGAAKSFP